MRIFAHLVEHTVTSFGPEVKRTLCGESLKKKLPEQWRKRSPVCSKCVRVLLKRETDARNHAQDTLHKLEDSYKREIRSLQRELEFSYVTKGDI